MIRALMILLAGGLCASVLIFLPALYFRWLQARANRRLRRAKKLLAIEQQRSQELAAARSKTIETLKETLELDELGMTMLTASERERIERIVRHYDTEDK